MGVVEDGKRRLPARHPGALEAAPERQGTPDALEGWFRTHPLEESRIKAARERISRIPPENLVGLTKDSPNFQAFKRRLAALPPSPPSR